jgi:hydrogenase maturation protease
MSDAFPIRVVGCGSPFGDDALGWVLVDRLNDRGWGPYVELYRVQGGQALLTQLDGRGSLVLIDALAPGGNPGRIVRLGSADPRLLVLRPGSTHDICPGEAIRLAEALGLLPEHAVIWGVEGEQFEAETALSPAVSSALHEVEHMVENEIETLSAGSGHSFFRRVSR